MGTLTRKIQVGNVDVGGDAPVSIQSMTTTNTTDTEATIAQIRELANAGCEIIRCSVPCKDSATSLKHIVDNVDTPVIADIHFSYSLAIAAMENGASCIRINPGNIGGEKRLESVIHAAKANNCSIRIGVNSGSIEKHVFEQHGITPTALVESALSTLAIFERNGFYNTKLSLKASHVPTMVESYRIFASRSDYPLHLGVTEAGLPFEGTVKSAVGIGALLLDGIGNTIRVSLTTDPLEEIVVAKEILHASGVRSSGVEIIACPTCARVEIDLFTLAQQVKELTVGLPAGIKIAVMGCIVNGPGEAREADYGIAGGRGSGILFKKGVILRKVSEGELLGSLEVMLREDGLLK